MSDRTEMEQFAHDHVEHWAQVANEAEARAERAEAALDRLAETHLTVVARGEAAFRENDALRALVRQLGEALERMMETQVCGSFAQSGIAARHAARRALVAFGDQFLGEGSGEK